MEVVKGQVNGTKIKLLALANGDVYQDFYVDISNDELLKLIKEREFINIRTRKNALLINSDFIVSIEI